LGPSFHRTQYFFCLIRLFRATTTPSIFFLLPYQSPTPPLYFQSPPAILLPRILHSPPSHLPAFLSLLVLRSIFQHLPTMPRSPPAALLPPPHLYTPLSRSLLFSTSTPPPSPIPSPTYLFLPSSCSPFPSFLFPYPCLEWIFP